MFIARLRKLILSSSFTIATGKDFGKDLKMSQLFRKLIHLFQSRLFIVHEDQGLG